MNRTKRSAISISIALLWYFLPFLAGYQLTLQFNERYLMEWSYNRSINMGEHIYIQHGDSSIKTMIVEFTYAGRFQNVISLANIQVGLFKAYAYNLFSEQKRVLINKIEFEILEATNDRILTKITFPPMYRNPFERGLDASALLTVLFLGPVLLVVIGTSKD